MKSAVAMMIMVIGLTLAHSAASHAVEKVNGIGGFFFKAKDPKTLAEWYETNLGVTKVPSSYSEKPWEQEKGPTIFAEFPEDTTYFGTKNWMINFRVKNLNRMVKQLRSSGISVDVDPKESPNGCFARLEDPEGNPIQLWEPKDPNPKSHCRN